MTSTGSPSPSPSPTPSPSSSPHKPRNLTSSLSRTTLSLLVILPSPEHVQQSHFAYPASPSSSSGSKPGTLTSRHSASRVPTRSNTPGQDSPQNSGTQRNDDVMDSVVDAGRRLSLAPGLGVGFASSPSRSRPTTSHHSAISSSPRIEVSNLDSVSPSSPSTPLTSRHSQAVPSPLVESTTPSPQASSTVSTPKESTGSGKPGVPAFGSKSPMNRLNRRRPITAAGPVAPSFASHLQAGRGSLAGGDGTGLGISGTGRGGKARIGWEGDEIVGMLRESGVEVTVVRNSSQIPSILSPSTSSPTFTSFNQQNLTARPSSAIPVTPVILVPLCDQPSLPSLSLLLQQGTTPTAVCFQQDLLDRAKIAEEQWLQSALGRLRAVVGMKDQSVRDALKDPTRTTTPEVPIVLAYSANPALSTHTISACVAAGASGVIIPPFDLETARTVRRMVRAAREGRISSIVGITGPQSGLTSPTAEEDDPFSRVILPPTALNLGGEMEGEKFLSGILRHHSRGASTQWDSRSSLGTSSSTSPPRQREVSIPARKSSLGKSRPSSAVGPRVTSPRPSIPHSTSTKSLVSPLKDTFPDLPNVKSARRSISPLTVANEARRRSIDVPYLELALQRAQRANDIAPYPSSPLSKIKSSARVEQGQMSPSNLFLQHTKNKPSIDSVSTAGQSIGGDLEQTHLAELLSAMYLQTQAAIQVRMDEFAKLSAPLSPAHRSRLVNAISSWNFRPHEMEEGDLYRIACILFEGALSSEGLVQLGVTRESLCHLLFAIKAIYHAPNPYHNYIHAIDVLQATYTFLADLELVPPYSHLRDLTPTSPAWQRPVRPSSSNVSNTQGTIDVLRSQDVLAILIAAMGHDVGHPGLSNAFMKNAKTPLSQVYDDKSVLENMHCMLIVQLLRKHNFGFLLDSHPIKMERNPARRAIDTRGFRRVLYSSILATDMSLHFAWVQELQVFGARMRHRQWDHIQESKSQVEEDRVIIAQAIIKCADISNPTRPIDVSEHWSTVLLKEWAIQASLETDLDLPVSVIASADAALQAKGQISFIDLFTMPLFEAVSDALPALQKYATSCADNRSLWSERLEYFKAGASVIIQPTIADAASDSRFAELFPLSLPTSLLGNGNGNSALPVESPEFPATHNTSDSDIPSPTSFYSFATESSGRYNPAANAIRAVYHDYLDHHPRTLKRKHNAAQQPPFAGDAAMSHYLETRRASAPDDLLSSQLAMALGR